MTIKAKCVKAAFIQWMIGATSKLVVGMRRD